MSTPRNPWVTVAPNNLREYRHAHRNGTAVPVRVMARRLRPWWRRVDWTQLAGTLLGVAILLALAGGIGWMIGRAL